MVLYGKLDLCFIINYFLKLISFLAITLNVNFFIDTWQKMIEIEAKKICGG